MQQPRHRQGPAKKLSIPGICRAARRRAELEAQFADEPAELHAGVVIHQEVHIAAAGGPSMSGPVSLPLAIPHVMFLERLGQPLEQALLRAGAG